MVFSELKSLCEALLTGDTKVPDYPVLSHLAHQALMRCASEAEALALVTQSKGFTLLRTINSDLYIRKPKRPVNDIDKIDIDEELAFAVANYTAASLSKKRPEYFKFEAMDIIANYNHKLLDARNELEGEDG
jgi:hypothetical protein